MRKVQKKGKQVMQEFKPDELVLVNVHENDTHEKWVPAIYREQLDGLSIVEMMKDSERKLITYPTSRIMHSEDAYDFKVHYEVYADVWRGTDVLKFEGLVAEQEATIEAQAWSKAISNKADIVVDKVLIGGEHVVRYKTEG